MRKIKHLCMALGLLALFCAGGCTHEVFLTNARVDPIANPQVGPAVAVVKVTDMRKFENDPADIQTPTVIKTADLANQAVTSRAAGKAKNNGHTMFFTYSPGQSVETSVRGAVENALREKGYVVAAQDAPSAAGAIPVEVEIHRCWLYWNVGFWTIQVDYDVEVDVKGGILLGNNTASAKAHYNIDSVYMATSICESCVGSGLGELTKDLKAKLKDAK